ncbi:glycosyltransferase [Niabella drilacis]|uniref:Glycosyltransferase involved in cell wall bisynthesis n=1 Tax=Niabella drilacis (strain DSM 25811 / CCM 8410 / CCUG 62505 / LMG 26954 / E90) TaxID=1285928 RepID=A0A1G6YBP4_NIADE|nr:glycosyltransferase [Niabella drilacis]SDD87752.1 Glycosyltransferase involved in cell wall bisynthesis [Niabella drilacis]
MRKVLWLCSWYPNRLSPFEGDFVQRHAQAASLYNQVHIIKLTPDPDGSGVLYDTSRDPGYPNLTEELIYYSKGRGPLKKIGSYYKWFRLYKKAVRSYISRDGMPDLIHVHIPFKAGWIALWAKRKFGIPYVVTEHWDGYNKVVDHNYDQRPSWFRRMHRRIFAKAAAVHSVSDYLGKEIQGLAGNVPYTVIPNVVNTALFFYKKRNHSGPFRCLHISNGAKKKNVEGLISVFSRLPAADFSFTVIGLPAALNSLYQEKYPFLRLPGGLSYSKVAEELQATDLLVIFSDSENSPCVIGEAFCCGVPVVSSDVGGIAELVNEANGVLVPARDEPALENAIRHVRRHYPMYDQEAIVQHALHTFPYAVVGKKITDWYGNIVSPTRKAD